MNGTGMELVFTEGTSNKFWRCLVLDTTVITHYGRIGAKGSTTVKHFTHRWDASAEAERLIDSKYRKGYMTAQRACAFPVDETLVGAAASASGHTGNGGTNPDATWRVIEAWELWSAYTRGMRINDIRALITDADTPDAVRALAVYDSRATSDVLTTIAADRDIAPEVRAAAFMRLQSN